MSGARRLILATAVPSSGGGLATAACLAVALAARAQAEAPGEEAFAAALLDGTATTRRRPTLLASRAAQRMEAEVNESAVARASARGSICWITDQDADRAEGYPSSLTALMGLDLAFDLVAYLPPAAWRRALDEPDLGVDGVLVRARRPDHSHLCSLLAGEMRERGIRHAIATSAPGLVASRRALAGIAPGGEAGHRAQRAAARLLGRGPVARSRAATRERTEEPPVEGDAAGAGRLAGETGQALPLMLGASFVVIVLALIAVAIGSATTGAGRVQRAADLAAVAAARSLRDDRPRLFEPPRLADGRPNPRALGEEEYLARARSAAVAVSRRAGIAPRRLRISFPASQPGAPTRASVTVAAELPQPVPEMAGAREREPLEVEARATAEAVFPTPGAGIGPGSGQAEGDYSGPLAYRQGKPMRPDVAKAFDRLAEAAAGAGVPLTINSAYRSDAEQAALFAANPDPTWVAPPGVSLHRCGTELDLGPPTAASWLAANAPRFGFIQRYSWESWHYGYDRGPAPCSPESSAYSYGEGDGESAGSGGLPAFVPARFRPAIAAAATRFNLPAGLLAAQLMAESGFDPDAVSPAGALGIAQFIPSTAAAYGLRDPFDANAAIQAQARLMADNLRRFGSIELALAAYNTGPGAVEACGCVPPYPETQAYVRRILDLMGGAGELSQPQLEVRLVA